MKVFLWALAVGMLIGLVAECLTIHRFPDDPSQVRVVPESK